MSVIDDVRDEVHALDEKVQEFFRTVDEILRSATTAPAPGQPAPPGGSGTGPGLVSPELAAAIRDALQRVHDSVQDFFDRLALVFDQPGDPAALRAVATGWTEVGNRLGTTAGEIGLDRMQSNIQWAGPAAEAYKALVPRQAANLATMKTQSLGMSGSLNNLADQLETFWNTFNGLVIGVAIAFALAIVGAISVVGIPAACAVIIAEIAAAVSAITFLIQARVALSQRIAAEQRAMAQSLNDLGPSWPAPNTGALADASVTDGDASDWRPNR